MTIKSVWSQHGTVQGSRRLIALVDVHGKVQSSKHHRQLELVDVGQLEQVRLYLAFLRPVVLKKELVPAPALAHHHSPSSDLTVENPFRHLQGSEQVQMVLMSLTSQVQQLMG